MEIEKIWKGDLLIIKITGEIDIVNASELRSEIEEAESAHNVCVDCSKLDYIDSTGIGVMISVLKQVPQNGGVVKLCALKPHIKKIFTLTNLGRLFELCDEVTF